MNGPPDGRAGLTRREREVAALVADGLTNRQIAERLFISERTADGHLEHIREKLGVRSRSQIAAWVIAQSQAPLEASPPGELVAPIASSRTISLPRSRRLAALAAAAVVVVLGVSLAAVARSRLDNSRHPRGPTISTVVGFGESGLSGGGYSGDGGPPTAAQLKRPQAVSPAPDGSYYVADSFNSRVRRVDTLGIISTVAGGAQVPFRQGALATSVNIGSFVGGVAVGTDRRVYFSTDLGAFRLDADGTLHRLVPAPASPWPGGIAGLAVDDSGTLFLAYRAEHVVMRLAPDGSLSTYAGSGEPGFSGDGGAATGARLEMPSALALDSKGNLYIADAGNNRVRLVDAHTGTITTTAGSQDIYGYGGDGGPAVRARLSLPSGVAVDKGGNLYVADTGNSRVRKVSRDGVITTIAGSGAPGLEGDGGLASVAQLFAPRGLAIDLAGDLYIADTGNHRVRKLGLHDAVGSS